VWEGGIVAVVRIVSGGIVEKKQQDGPNETKSFAKAPHYWWKDAAKGVCDENRNKASKVVAIR